MDLEFCTMCDELTEIAVRGGEVLVCYDCAALAESG